MKFLIVFCLSYTLLSHSIFAQLAVSDLTCNYQTNPLGIDILKPKLSWKITSKLNNVLQTYYEIRVSTDPKAIVSGNKLIWNSGKVKSAQSIQVGYNGPDLKTGTRYFWQVRVFDNHGNTSRWSAVNYWEMGLLSPKDWTAKWIGSKLGKLREGPVSAYRKEFKATAKVRSARIYITGHGVYEAYINGLRIGEDYFAPGWTSYNKRLQYQSYDVTSLIQTGANTVGVLLGDGWFKGNLSGNNDTYGTKGALLCQLRIDYEDGKSELITTDDSWKTSVDGPIRKSDFYQGEHYDARMEYKGWKRAGFDDKGWVNSDVDEKIPYTQLVGITAPAIRLQERFKPKSITVTDKGDKIIDFGQNLVGWVEFTVNGKSGDSIQLLHAEVLDRDGKFYTQNLRSAKQEVIYILNGKGKELYHPHFSFQGFRYVKVSGKAALIDMDNVEAVALYSDMPETGKFHTSNPLINQLQHNIKWGQLGNFIDVPTDCPQRDERLGWTGDAQVFFKTAAYNRNVAGFFTKWLADLKADQFSSGAVSNIVPNVWPGEQGGSLGWADAATIIPWDLYQAYADTTLLAAQYSSMKSWIGFITANSERDLWNKGWHFGDWLSYSPNNDLYGKAAITDKQLMAQAFYINSLQIMINTTGVLNKPEDKVVFVELLKKAKQAFITEFMTPSGRLIAGTQTAYVLTLQFDVLPEDMRQQAAKRLVDNIRSYGNHLTTGFLGTPYLCHVLSRFGYEDVAYTLLMQETYPSWLYPVKKGATTMWERWDGIKPDGSFQNPAMNSFNHYAYGAVGDWMYRNIAGIQHDINKPGYKHFKIAPKPGGGLTSANGELESPYGKIASSWKLKDKVMEMEVIVPPNTTATLYFPTLESNVVELKSGKERTLTNAPHEVGSGIYHFKFSIK